MSIFTDYAKVIEETLAQIAAETEAIEQGATLIAEAIARDELIHVIGPGGHSNMAVEETFWRAGGFACIDGILDAGTNLIHGAKRSTAMERMAGYGIAVMDAYRLNKPGEVLIIANAYGINSMTIDVATEARIRGLKTIGITSDSYAKTVPAGLPQRHPSGKNLYENVDVYINNHLPIGDAIMEIEGSDAHMGPMSTFCNCFAMNCLMMRAAQKLVEMGIKPPVLISGNMPGGNAANKALEEKYIPRVKHLK